MNPNYLKAVLENADRSMIPEPEYLDNKGKIFHVQGIKEVFFSLKPAKREADKIGCPIVTQSKLVDGKEIFEDFYYFNDGKEWGKYKGKERID